MQQQIQPRTADHPNGLRIEFHPEPHEYILNGNKLTSVTKVIHKYFPQFDAETVARRKAERDGGSAEDLIAQWQSKRDAAATFGSKVHLMAERIILEGDDRAADALPADEREKRYLEALKGAIVRVRKAYDFVETEKIIFSPSAGVAGTIDLLLRNKETGEWVIGDWKTNREIKFEAYRRETGFGPCQDLPNCNFIHYSLQTAAYSSLLTTESYLPTQESVRGVLFHLREHDGRTVTCEFIKTRHLQPVASQLLMAPNFVTSSKS